MLTSTKPTTKEPTPGSKSYKPLMLTGVIPVIKRNRVDFLNGQSVAVGKFCTLFEKEGMEFDPTKYCVMSITKKELDLAGEMQDVSFRFIADMTPEMYQSFIRAQQQAYRKPFEDSLRVKHVIHLFSKNGTYIIESINAERSRVLITCNKWQTEHERGDRPFSFESTSMSDIKCLAGGLHNTVMK